MRSGAGSGELTGQPSSSSGSSCRSLHVLRDREKFRIAFRLLRVIQLQVFCGDLPAKLLFGGIPQRTDLRGRIPVDGPRCEAIVSERRLKTGCGWSVVASGASTLTFS